MEKNKDVLFVVITSLIFGIISKILVGVPYMAWGYFDQLFIASFILWMLYTAMLYLGMKMQEENNGNYIKIVFGALVFGIVTACLKMGIDAVIEQLVKSANNLIITALAMELGILIFGSAVIFSLYFYIAKIKKIVWNKSMKIYVGVLGSTLGVYFAVIIYYLWQLKHWMERFANIDLVKEIGVEQGIFNLSTKYARESTTIGMIVYVVFFIILWIALKKHAEKNEA